MHVAVTGSTGLIGEALIASLERDGHVVHRVVRDRAAATGTSIYWSVAQGEIDAAAFAGLDAVVHLAAEPIGARRWTAKQKARIHESRVAGTRLLATALAGLDNAPPVLLSASAVGFYGDRGEELLDETSGPGSDFMAQVCQDWEVAATPAAAAGIRVVHPRTGVVMARKGPLIEKVEVPFKLGVGGRVGSGRQWVPWIALGDHVRAMRFLLDRDDINGPVNLVAPEPVRNVDLTRALGEAMHRPTVMPVPVFALRLLYGEVAVALGTVSQRVVPAVLREAGFEWREPDLLGALQTALA
jgi:uncharacterized protein